VTVVLVALVFWGWLLGPLGAVLATPLTLFVKILLVDVDPRARWANALIGPAPPAPTPPPPTPPTDTVPPEDPAVPGAPP